MFEKYISEGIEQPVHELHGHKRAEFIKRFLMMSGDIVPESKCSISVSIVDGVPKTAEKYASVHVHKCDEIYLLLGEPGKLVYEFVLGNETHTVKSPAAVFVPKRLPHRVEAVSGSGQLVAVLLAPTREKSLVFKE